MGFFSSKSRFILVPYLLVLIGFIGFFSLLKEPETLSYIQARADKMSITVISPELMRLQTIYFNVKIEVESNNLSVRAPSKPITLSCVAALLEPTTGTKVTYIKNDDKLTIALERSDNQPAAQFKNLTSPHLELFNKSSFITMEKAECKERNILRLPVFGYAQVGDENRVAHMNDAPASNPLIEGRIFTYGKTLQNPYFKTWLKNSLYFVSEITVPSGARIYEEKQEKPAIWSGFITFDEEDGMKVDVTTSAKNIALQIAGSNTEPYIISISNIAQIINDPNILNIQLFSLCIVFSLQILALFIKSFLPQ